MFTRCETIRSRAVLSVAVAAATAISAFTPTPSLADPADPTLSSERRGIGAQPLAGGNGTIVIDPRKSLAVTDQAILSSFSLFETMNTLMQRGGSASTSFTDTRDLFRMWWDTQNEHAHLQFPDDSLLHHCDDPLREAFPGSYACPRAEGEEATLTNNPFDSAVKDHGQGYIAIGLFNRFDLAAVDGSDCGEYRIVFGRNSGRTNRFDRNLLIFEASLPNPNPAQGLLGCLPVAKFWHDLGTMSVSARAAALHSFYFDGLPGFSPVVDPANYGAGPSKKGQIRTNQFMAPLPTRPAVAQDWMLREFKMTQRCISSTSCTLRIVPSTVKTNPFAGLFGGTNTLSLDFQNDFVNNQVALLAEPDINRFNYFPPERFNSRESDEQEVFSPSNYRTQTSPAFLAAIAAKLASIPNTTVTATQIVNRAMALSCAGCHFLSPQSSNNDIGGGQVAWPLSMGFTQISEQNADVETGPDGSRFGISLALKNVFLPHRQAVLATFLENAGVPGP